ncbi:ATP-binding protein [Candidatus Saccharibacteria bacterium]|nr:ATP-binding protein [Candidatus Saccharibacteria bacterium]
MGLFSRSNKSSKLASGHHTSGNDTSDLIINSISDGVVLLDSTGNIRVVNPGASTITGWRSKDAFGLNYLSVVKLVDDKDVEAKDSANPIAETLKTCQPKNTDALFLLTKSNRRINVDVSVSPVSNNENRGAIVVFRDITLRKQNEEEKSNFISTASHEMRTPVAIIEGYLGMLLNSQLATIDDRAKNYVEKAHENSQHLGNLFQDLLDITQLDDNRMEQHPSPINAIDFLRGVAEDLQPKAKEKNLQLVFAMGNYSSAVVMPTYHIMADKDHLLEILENVIDNAIKYTDNGSVDVSVDGDVSKVRFVVKDSGVGIAPEDVSHLFQKFYRVNNDDTREVGGTGLGLYLVKKMAESMDGRVWLESEPKKGSTFYIEFPRISDAQVNLYNNQDKVLKVQNPLQQVEPEEETEAQTEKTPETDSVSDSEVEPTEEPTAGPETEQEAPVEQEPAEEPSAEQSSVEQPPQAPTEEQNDIANQAQA